MGDMMLIEIGDRAISDYQAARLQEGTSGSTINGEVMFTLHMMGEIGDAVRLKLRREKRAQACPKTRVAGRH